MNKYPNYLTNEPKPLVFVTGTIENEPDIHTKIIKTFESTTKDPDNKDQPSISFRSVAPDYVFPEKKPTKDQITTEGILKYNWPSKHFEQVPSVVVFTVSISVDWGPTEWQRREFAIQEKFNRMKNILNARDIKLMVIGIKTGAGTIDKDVIDERISSFKKHLQLNSNIFAFVAPNEVNADSSYLKKVGKSIKESSTAYYSSKIKHLKSIQKGISEKYRGPIESILHARFCFKIAFFYEFQGQAGHSLKYYRQCYQALSLSIETIDEVMFEQIKTVAEMAHFKICNMLLFSTSVLEAFQQFKSHMTRFSKLYSEFPWKHYAWVSDQYVVFTQLLELYAVNDSLPDADRAYYYHNAARYSQKRQMSFDKTRKEMDLQKSVTAGSSSGVSERQNSKSSTSGGREVYKGMMLMPPRFIGSSAQILDPVLDQLQPSAEEATKLYNEYCVEQEYKVNHNSVIMKLLNLALERTNTNFKRRKGFVLSLIAEQCIKEEQFSIALQYLCQSADLLAAEGWVAPAVAVFGLIMKCATLLGRPQEYLNAALTLYANASSLFFSRYELEDLHLSVASVLESTLCSNNTTVKPTTLPKDNFQYKKLGVRNRGSFLSTSNYVSVLHKPEYGTCATTDKPIEYSLADPIIDMSGVRKMFGVQVNFDNSVVELGHKVLVKVTLTSKFMDEMVFDELKIYFTDNAIVKRVVHCTDPNKITGITEDGKLPNTTKEKTDKPKSANLMKRIESSENMMHQHMANNSDVIYTPLIFPSNKPLTIEFFMYISETGFASFLNPDSILCLERIEMVLHNDTTSNGKQVVFDVAALPENVIKARKNVLKPVSLKDIIKYNYNENFATLSIQKPSALVTMIKPEVPTEGLQLLQGAVHRINVFFKVGACDMLDGCVYLSSDYDFSCEDDSLFWYPDKTQLADLLASHKNPSDELLDTVRFHALALNDSQQPAVPISLGPVCTTDSVLFVPVFVKSSYVQVVNLKLRIEYVPRGRLKSSVSKEFTIKVNFLQALDMSFKVAPASLAHDNNAGTLFIGEDNLLSASLHCINSLNHAIGVSECLFDVTSSENRNLPCVVLGSGTSREHTRANLFESVSKLANGSKFPVKLRSGETFCESQYIKVGDSTSTKIFDPTQAAVFSVGGVTVHWRQLRRHVLRHTIKNAEGQQVVLNNLDWLLPLGHRAAVTDASTNSHNALNYETSISAVGATYFTVPDAKLVSSPFVVDVEVPSISIFGQLLELKVVVKSQVSSSERLKFSLSLNENFLVAGSTYCSLEVPSNGEQNVALTLVPLKCGFIALPPLLITWERSPTVSVKVLDTSSQVSSQPMHSIFIHPCEVVQQ